MEPLSRGASHRAGGAHGTDAEREGDSIRGEKFGGGGLSRFLFLPAPPLGSPLIQVDHGFTMSWRLTLETEYCAVAEEEEESRQVHTGGGVRGWGL